MSNNFRILKDVSEDVNRIRSELIVEPGAGLKYETRPLPAASGATPLTVNQRVGTVTFTGLNVAGAQDAGAAQVINNSFVTASSNVLVNLVSTTAAANSSLVVKSITLASGTISVLLSNPSATGTGACTATLLFQVLN